jgi:hypothetical protein
MEMLNDKEHSNEDAGQRVPGGVATCDPEASNDETSPKKSSQKHDAPC